jgi:glycerol-3-phosphate dehydrogenase (NAD(P)+)
VLSIPKDTRIAVVGDGGWGTTLALHLARKGTKSTVWGAFPAYLREIETSRENRKFLPGFPIPEAVEFEPDLEALVQRSGLVILAVPSRYLRGVLKRVPRAGVAGRVWLSVSKGIELRTHRLPSEVVEAELGRVPFAALSGPTIAREVAQGFPTAVVVASRSRAVRAGIRKLMSSDHFTVYESDDVKGVELGGSLKNVIAIAAGIVDGLGYGSNTKSILLARGIAEMVRLGTRMGAKRATFMGLSGLGDLATTCFSIHSRNHACGVALGQGKGLAAIVRSTEMVIEGVDTAKSAWALARRKRVFMPIVEAVHGILFGGKSPRAAIEALMHKALIRETD